MTAGCLSSPRDERDRRDTAAAAIVYWIASVFTWDEVKKFAREHMW